MVKTTLFDCAVNEKCCSVDGHLHSFIVPTVGDLTAQESPPPTICHPRQKKCLCPGVSPEGGGGGGGAGRSWIDSSSSSHVVGNKKFTRIMFAEKRSPILWEITLNFKESAKFPSRIKTIVSQKFSRVMNAISEQNISHVTDGRVCYNWSL